jgi:hypothetical protein
MKIPENSLILTSTATFCWELGVARPFGPSLIFPATDALRQSRKNVKTDAKMLADWCCRIVGVVEHWGGRGDQQYHDVHIDDPFLFGVARSGTEAAAMVGVHQDSLVAFHSRGILSRYFLLCDDLSSAASSRFSPPGPSVAPGSQPTVKYQPHRRNILHQHLYYKYSTIHAHHSYL